MSRRHRRRARRSARRRCARRRRSAAGARPPDADAGPWRAAARCRAARRRRCESRPPSSAPTPGGCRSVSSPRRRVVRRARRMLRPAGPTRRPPRQRSTRAAGRPVPPRPAPRARRCGVDDVGGEVQDDGVRRSAQLARRRADDCLVDGRRIEVLPSSRGQKRCRSAGHRVTPGTCATFVERGIGGCRLRRGRLIVLCQPGGRDHRAPVQEESCESLPSYPRARSAGLRAAPTCR